MWKITKGILTIVSPIVGVLSLLFGDNLIARWHLNWLPYFLFGVGFAWSLSWIVDSIANRSYATLTPEAVKILAKLVETYERLDVGRDDVRIGNVKYDYSPLAAKELLNAGFIRGVSEGIGDWRFMAYTVTTKGVRYYHYWKIIRAFK